MDPENGWIVDFANVKDAWKELGGRLDHKLLNEVSGLENPTAENLAEWIWAQFEGERLGERVRFCVIAVEVAETADSKALFVAPGRTPWIPGNPSLGASAPSVADGVDSPNGEEGTAHTERCANGIQERPEIEDVQARSDDRGIAIDEVGVNRVRMPIEVLDRSNARQTTVAHVNLGVDVPADVKGTHLSRFMEGLRDHQREFTLFNLGELTRSVRQRLDGRYVRLRVDFPYFITKAAPVSAKLGELDVDCAFEVIDRDGSLEHWLEVTTPISTVCPCSRDISDYGAHNQRGHVIMRVACTHDEAELPSLVWIEELVEIAESAASSPVYPVVKRPDERHITMAAYDRPQFVEDVARDVALALRSDSRINGYDINVVSHESIHAHSAFSRLTG